MTEALDEVLSPLRAAPERALLAFDFDGTLSAVVDEPAAAVPLPGVVDLLDELADAYASVAVVSGRPVSFLAEHLPDHLTLCGLYGLEERVDGETRAHDAAQRWRPVVDAVAEQAARRCSADGPLAGAVVEAKGVSLTLHVRTRPDLEGAVRGLAEELAEPVGLEVRPAKRSVELHPPLAVDKGTALRALAAGLDAALYVGDDVGDVAAFESVRAMVADATLRAGVCVAVGGAELPDEVARLADVVLDDQAEVLGLLRGLRTTASP